MTFHDVEPKINLQKTNPKKATIMARTTTARYTIEAEEALEADLEQFTEADAENLEFTPEDLEELEAESIENINLEDVNPESIAESLEISMEGEEAEAYGGYTRPSAGRTVNKRLLKTFTSLVKKLIKKIMSNPRTRTRLQAATRKGPTAVAKLLTPRVAQMLPSYFRWMAPIYVPRVTRALSGPIRQQVGVKAEEVEEAPEWDSTGIF